jgi:hypothetical protein
MCVSFTVSFGKDRGTQLHLALHGGFSFRTFVFPCLHNEAVEVLDYIFDLTFLTSIFLIKIVDRVSTCHQFQSMLPAPY